LIKSLNDPKVSDTKSDSATYSNSEKIILLYHFKRLFADRIIYKVPADDLFRKGSIIFCSYSYTAIDHRIPVQLFNPFIKVVIYLLSYYCGQTQTDN